MTGVEHGAAFTLRVYPEDRPHTYGRLLAGGRILCGTCGRMMDGDEWLNGVCEGSRALTRPKQPRQESD